MLRNNALKVGNACNPIMVEQLVRSILLCQQQKLPKLEYELNDAIWQDICKHKNPCANDPEPSIKETIDSFDKSENKEG